ncbi:hypothetical protein E2P64_06450 [Candidatus Bathyarchaeota archaeon]|nr:hypothetical protein E2P64_06450 [Candidatus Bathyarchaeota archaeon]
MTSKDWKWEFDERGYVYRRSIKEGQIAKYVLRREGTGSTGAWTLEIWQSHRAKPNIVFNYLKTRAEGIHLVAFLIGEGPMWADPTDVPKKPPKATVPAEITAKAVVCR